MYPPRPSVVPPVAVVLFVLVAALFVMSSALAAPEATPRHTPEFVACPELVEGSHCETLTAQVRAELSNRRNLKRRIRYHLVSGPGEVDSATGVWSLDGGSLGPGNHFEMVELAASWRQHSTAGDENCRFAVRVLDYPPEFACNVSGHFEVSAPGVSAIEMPVSDPDDCDSVVFGSLDVRPEPVGEIVYDVRSGLLVFDAEEEDAGLVYTVTVRVQSGDHGYSGRVYLHTRPIDPIVLSLGQAEGDIGDTIELPLTVESAPQFFDLADLLMQYDRDRLSFIGAKAGPAFFDRDGCQWYRFEAREALIRGYSGDFISIQAVARERRQDPQEPCIMPDVFPAEFCRLKFEIKEKHVMSGEVMPVRFFWSSCHANVLMDRYRYERRVCRQVFDWDGSPMQGDIDPPTLFGLSDSCYSCGLSGERMRAVEFHNGSVRVSTPPPIELLIGMAVGRDHAGIVPGTSVDVDIAAVRSGYEFGGFDLNIAFRVDALTFQQATAGEAVTACGWEYFTYQFPNRTGGDVVRVRGIAETNNGDAHPSCISPESYPAVLATLQFGVSSDPIYSGEFLPVCVKTLECDDNIFQSTNYDTVYFTGEVLQLTPFDILPESIDAPGDRDRPINSMVEPADFIDSCISRSRLPGRRAVKVVCGGILIRDLALDVGDDGEAGLPVSFGLEQNYPNPFNNETVISFSLPVRSPVELVVYNVLGETVYRHDGEYPAGVHQVAWPGIDAAGKPVASGVYYYRLTAGEYTSTRKMVLLK